MCALAVIAVSCVRVIPAVEDADASLNYGKALMNEGKFALAIIEFKKARDFFNEAGYTYSAFSVYPYIARGYYLSGSREEAIATYFEALAYAKDRVDEVGQNDTANVMRELAGLLVEDGRVDEARYLLMDAAQLYNKAENFKALDEVMKELDLL
jgi:tetratricopeptide (TPR) repeat protein